MTASIKNIFTTVLVLFALASFVLLPTFAQAQIYRTNTTASATTKTPTTASSSSLYWGAPQSSETVELQKELQELGYYSGPIDGSFARSTYDAVRAFQLRNNLKADGVAGPETLTQIQSSAALSASVTAKVPVQQVTIQEPAPSITPLTQVISGTLKSGSILPACNGSTTPWIYITDPDDGDEFLIDPSNLDLTVEWQTCNVPSSMQVDVILAEAGWSPGDPFVDLETEDAGDEEAEFLVNYNDIDLSEEYEIHLVLPAYFNHNTDEVEIEFYTDTQIFACEIEDLEIDNSGNNYSTLHTQLSGAGFSSQQANQLIPLLTGLPEQFSVGDKVELEWDAEGPSSVCNDYFSEETVAQLIPAFISGPNADLDLIGGSDIEDGYGEYEIENAATGFYRAHIYPENYPNMAVVSQDVIYINSGSSGPSLDPECLEIRPNSSNSPQVISSASSQVAEFEIENVCDDEVEFESFDFKVISSWGIPQFDDIEVEIDGDDLSGDTDISTSFNSAIGGQDMYFTIDGDNFELDPGDEVDLIVYGDVIGAYSPWNGSSQKSTAFAVALDDIDYEYDGDNYDWNQRPVWDNLIVVHYAN